MEKIEAVIFDMDGVLVETEHLKYQATEKVLQEYGVKELPFEEYAKRIGLNSEEFWDSIIKLFNLKTTFEELHHKWLKAFMPLLAEISLSQGAEELLKKIKDQGFKLALATAADQEEIDFVLGKLKENYFQAIVSGEEVKNSKPNPEIFLKAAEKLGVKPENCLVIEDSLNGVRAAKNAGMKCLAVLTEYMKDVDLSLADFQVNSLNEFDFEKFLRGE